MPLWAQSNTQHPTEEPLWWDVGEAIAFIHHYIKLWRNYCTPIYGQIGSGSGEPHHSFLNHWGQCRTMQRWWKNENKKEMPYGMPCSLKYYIGDSQPQTTRSHNQAKHHHRRRFSNSQQAVRGMEKALQIQTSLQCPQLLPCSGGGVFSPGSGQAT